jgi:hypothetical protein
VVEFGQATLMVVAVAQPGVATAILAAFVSAAEIAVLAAIELPETLRLVCAVFLQPAEGRRVVS